MGFSSSKSIMMTLRDQIQKKYNFDPQSLTGTLIKHGSYDYKLTDILTGKRQGKRSYTYKAHCKTINHTVCCKIYFSEMLQADTSNKWKEEFIKPNRVQSSHIAHYIADGDFETKGIKLVWIFYEWISGEPLDHYLAINPDKINISFLTGLAEWILAPLRDIETAGSTHGDIHLGNIMVIHEQIPPITTFKLIDFGVKDSEQGLKTRDDYSAIGDVLARILTKIDYPIELADKFIYDSICQHYIKLLKEDDPNRDTAYKKARNLYEELNKIKKQSERIKTGAILNEKLQTPFEVISADRFQGDSQLLWKLFSNAIPGYDLLKSKETVVISGPRGCGKTMILRNLSLRTYLSNPSSTKDDIPINVGFYLASYELWLAFPKTRKDDKEVPEKIADDNYQKRAAYFFHLCLLEEVIGTLEILRAKFSDDFITMIDAEKIAKFVNENFRLYECPPGQNILVDLRIHLQKWRSEFKQQKSYKSMDGPGFLRDFCRFLQQEISFFNGRRIVFLLDDYSLGKITPALQLSLNRIIFQRTPEFEFKISTEKGAIYLRDMDGPIDQSRTHFELDIGYYFIDPEKADAREKFLTEVFNNRLHNAENIKYTDIRTILGNTQYRDYKQFAEVLAGIYKSKPGDIEVLRNPKYHGMTHLVEICSGDVAAMIHLVQTIILESRFDLTTSGKKQISPDDQDEAIKNFSSTFLNQIGGEQKNSNQVKSIAKAFGALAQWKLKNQTSMNEGKITPMQVCRLEVYEDHPLEDDATANELFKDVLRYAIFIREPRGFAQGEEKISLRLYFRRLFIPTYGLSFSRRDCIRLHINDFIDLLKKPNLTKNKLINRWKKKHGKIGDDKEKFKSNDTQMNLPSFNGKEFD